VTVTGPGKVTSSDGRVNCTGGTCTLRNIERLDSLTLTAAPTRERTFLRGWGGDCSREREHPTCAITFGATT